MVLSADPFFSDNYCFILFPRVLWLWFILLLFGLGYFLSVCFFSKSVKELISGAPKILLSPLELFLRGYLSLDSWPCVLWVEVFCLIDHY